jgi:hypothetical protein
MSLPAPNADQNGLNIFPAGIEPRRFLERWNRQVVFPHLRIEQSQARVRAREIRLDRDRLFEKGLCLSFALLFHPDYRQKVHGMYIGWSCLQDCLQFALCPFEVARGERRSRSSDRRNALTCRRALRSHNDGREQNK